jgi:DNA-binding Lrp family transcriptional regulator
VTPSWHVDGDPAAAQRLLHTMPFMIKHGLADNPLFEPKNLVSVAQAAMSRAGDVYFDAGDASLTDKWGNIPIPDMPIEQVLNRIEHAKAWVILKHIEKDPRYAEVLGEFAKFVLELAGPEKAKDILNPEMIVIVSSPHRVTPFHFDAEINFLVQVRGSKEVWICDPSDRSILSEADVEDYYSGNIAAGRYKPEFEQKAKRVVLKPGDGVHIPSHAAHWIKNGDGISVSVSLNFEFPPWRANVYKANHVLRKLGMSPKPPGLSPTQDALKQHMPIQSMSRVKNAIRAAVKG